MGQEAEIISPFAESQGDHARLSYGLLIYTACAYHSFKPAGRTDVPSLLFSSLHMVFFASIMPGMLSRISGEPVMQNCLHLLTTSFKKDIMVIEKRTAIPGPDSFHESQL